MDITQSLIDLLRAAHLMCFAAGMGTAVYFDFQSFKTLNAPITPQSIEDLKHLHRWIYVAFAGLWLTGLTLVYVRTSFDIAAFSPKLWLKLGLMTLMLANSWLIGRFVTPIIKANTGASLLALPPAKVFFVTQVGVLSMFCWTSGLLLGSSVVLKTASWAMLLPAAAAWFILLTLAGQALIVGANILFRANRRES